MIEALRPMTDREKLTKLSKEIDDLNAVADKAIQDTSPIQEKLTKIRAKVIKDEKLLAQTWKITSTKHVLVLEAVEDWEGFPELRELLKPDYHENYAFWGYATYLCFDDGTVSLRLQHGDALQFIRDHGITVDLSNLTKERDKLAVRFDAAKALLADMKELTT